MCRKAHKKVREHEYPDVSDYLKSIGWTEEDIKWMILKEEANREAYYDELNRQALEEEWWQSRQIGSSTYIPE